MNNNWARGVIAMVDELRDAYTAAGLDVEHKINFPQIVVVGNQVLFVHVKPIELRLHYVTSATNRPIGVKADQDWVVFEHKPHEPFTDFAKVRDEIQAQFEEVQNDKSIKTISSVPIILNIYSRNAVDITLVDLPGLIAIASDNHSKTLKKEIEDLVDKNIKPDNTLILAVCPANQDLNTVMALSRVKDVDPDHKRTLMVLTMIDIMNDGTDAVAVLNGDKMRFSLGIVGVINRSQLENDKNLTSKECLEKEQSFFSKDPYAKFKDQSGIEYLCHIVNKILVDKIKETLPREEAAITKMIHDKEKELEKLAKPIAAKDRKKVLTRVTNRFEKLFRADIKGDEKLSGTKELNTGAQITLLYRELTTKLNSIDPTDDLTDDEIKKAWLNASGSEPIISTIDKTLVMLVRTRIKRFKGPCSTTVYDVYQILKRFLDSCEYLKEKKDQFPNMVHEIEKIFNQVLDSRLNPTEHFIYSMIDGELDNINRANVDFVGDSAAANKQMETVLEIEKIFINKTQKENSQCYAKSDAKVPAANLATGDASAVPQFGILIKSYFNIVLKKIQDSMQKYINLFLIDAILDGDDGLLNELNEQLNCESRLDELFRESEWTAKFRSETTNAIETLKKARETIEEGNTQKTITWTNNHVRCNQFHIYGEDDSNQDEALLNFFVTGAQCTSSINIGCCDPKAVVDFVKKFMDLEISDEVVSIWSNSNINEPAGKEILDVAVGKQNIEFLVGMMKSVYLSPKENYKFVDALFCTWKYRDLAKSHQPTEKCDTIQDLTQEIEVHNTGLVEQSLAIFMKKMEKVEKKKAMKHSRISHNKQVGE
ncbi:dynamin central region domain-containing protein [Ditylenchus destructor]|uniref:Dynamin central region domain-containing protein n=1 Tax=Ditylenchus destructor TaxID=166010 RepID=A0AAD4MM79_9BILA|nr:dynamin central region domain-containing protein [Ditylenchus destructor]